MTQSPALILFGILIFGSVMNSAPAFAGEQVGTLTQIEGDVKLFSHPSKELQKGTAEHPHALFEGEYFLAQEAKVGDRVEKGNILRTALTAKARVVFDNGDQFNVGPGTAYRVSWNKDAAFANTDVNLMYGKLRGIVAKGGPRSHLQIRTKSATMGVRGTDFFIAENGVDGDTEVSILRGAVEVKSNSAPANEPPVKVESGYSATIPSTKADPVPAPSTAATLVAETRKVITPPVVDLHKTTQEDLVAIQKASKLVKPTERPAALAPDVTRKLDGLEVKAVQTTLNDIKTHDPALFAKIDTQTIKSVDEINTTAVKTLLESAPKAETARKLHQTEMENLDNGAYERYFKIIEE